MNKITRHQFIRELIQNKKIKNQAQLVDFLQAEGFKVTQATISRDITELGLKKEADQSYILPEIKALKDHFKTMVLNVDSSGNLVVIKTVTGAAQTIASIVDGANFEQILGTVAGDDTILVIIKEGKSAKDFTKKLESFIQLNLVYVSTDIPGVQMTRSVAGLTWEDF